MALSPEQREAWEKEKQKREENTLSAEEEALKRKQDQARIDTAIKKTARLEKKRKWVFIVVVAIYLVCIVLYFILR